MYQNVLESISGIGLYGVISIVIFFGFFSLMLTWAFTLKKNYLNNMGSLPLQDEEFAPEKTAKRQP